MFSYKIHKSGNDILLAIADAEIVGKDFFSDNHNISISREFYGESKADESEVIFVIKSANIVNAIGERSIGMLLKNGVIEKEGIIKLCGLPHAQIICM